MEDFPELRLPRFGSDLAVDVYEKDNKVIAEMNLPGVNPDEIDIDVEEDYVRVTGSREEKTENSNADYYYQEIQRGGFERSFRLPTKVDPMGASAEFEDGVLTISVPIASGQKPKKVKPTRVKKAAASTSSGSEKKPAEKIEKKQGK
jgi:HSP20 family protein